MATKKVPDYARNLSRIRRAEQMTLKALATKCGLSESHLSQIERGQKEPSLTTLTTLAAALGVQLGALFNERGTPTLTSAVFKLLAWQKKHGVTDHELAKMKRILLVLRDN